MAVKQTRLTVVIVGLLLGILMSAMDNTIVATAMGTIVAKLGGLDRFVWVTSAYMVTEMAGMPIFGKLSDMYGRKRFFAFGVIAFLVGSMLCGTANSITQLIIYRALQGIGGGALAPIAFTILFDAAPLELRGKMGGMFGAVFGLSSIFGPLLGAYITEYISWHWVFYINVPLGVLAFIMVMFFYRESVEHAKPRIDWLGVFTLVPAIASLMFALQLGGQKYGWGSETILGLFALSALFFLAFLTTEAKVPEPIISYPMFRVRLYAVSNMVALFQGATYILAVLYIPIFIQGVFGGTATNSGLALLPMMLGTVVTSQVGILFARKFSYRAILLVSGLVFGLGIAALATLTQSTSRLVVTLYMILVGLGTGPFFSVLGVSVMQPFSSRQRGVASSTSTFIRSLGMTVGVTIFGIVQRNLMKSRLANEFSGTGQGAAPKGFNISDPHAMLSPAFRSHIPSFILTKLTDALSVSVVHTFAFALIPAAIVLVFALFLGKDRMDPSAWGDAKEMGDATPKAGDVRVAATEGP